MSWHHRRRKEAQAALLPAAAGMKKAPVTKNKMAVCRRNVFTGNFVAEKKSLLVMKKPDIEPFVRKTIFNPRPIKEKIFYFYILTTIEEKIVTLNSYADRRRDPCGFSPCFPAGLS
ncbi:hypothetical protein [Agrobacterium sp. NPDC089420]|uniref:hypothetical protein n=1 Tax=Agrobacterium sp. NPDC089420 TaxID=3363918 RepID=UPI00384FD3DA